MITTRAPDGANKISAMQVTTFGHLNGGGQGGGQGQRQGQGQGGGQECGQAARLYDPHLCVDIPH